MATDDPQILSYGGGRQTVALCILVARGLLPRPDRIVIADTGREKQTTWDWMNAYAAPLMKSLGLEIEVASRALAKMDLYAHNGDLLMPVYTRTGKLPTYCSNEWKARVVRRHLRAQGITAGTMWIGFTLDEESRIRKAANREPGAWPSRFPLTELMLTKANCIQVIEDWGWPVPPPVVVLDVPQYAEFRMAGDPRPSSRRVRAGVRSRRRVAGRGHRPRRFGRLAALLSRAAGRGGPGRGRSAGLATVWTGRLLCVDHDPNRKADHARP